MSWLDFKFLICVGSGGVGKTTVASALGIQAAQSGKKVLVLTIDPSMRLAQALGIENTSEITKVPGQNYKGELWASVIQHQKVFDDFVRRAAQKSPSVEKIFQNKLYQQMSTTLSGSQEFTALEKLYNVYETKQFDLIILDTPPSQHAVDFLKAPMKLGALFKKSITQWFEKPDGAGAGFLKNILQAGTKQVLKALELLTGSDFIQQLTDFFSNVHDWQEELENRVMKVQQILKDQQTGFVVVTSFDEAHMMEAQILIQHLQQNKYFVCTVVLNRSFPDWLETENKSGVTHLSESLVKELQRLTDQFKSYYQNRKKAYEEFEARLQPEVRLIKIPDYLQNPSDLQSLESLSSDFRTS